MTNQQTNKASLTYIIDLAPVLSRPQTKTTHKMSRVYLLVRLQSENSASPSYRTHNITTAELPDALQTSTLHTIKEYAIIDEDADGPGIYRIAIDIVTVIGKDMHICYGTTSYNDAVQRLHKIPQYAKELDKERRKINSSTTLECRWIKPTCIEFVFKAQEEVGFLWYELVEVMVEDQAKSDVEEEIDQERDKKRRKKAEMKNVDI
jgi:hypothetical protein